MCYSALRAQRTPEVHDRSMQEDATWGEREGRTLAPGRFLLLASLVLLAVLFTPEKAFAATGGVLWGPGDLPGGDRGVVVGADNAFDAAALALGYSYSDIQSWSPEIKAKLSNASTGGNFYTFTQKFTEFDGDVDLPGVLGALANAVGSAFFAVVQSLYGNNIWLAAYDQSLGLNAALDLRLILQGGDIGGGSTGPSDEYFIFDFKSKSEYFTSANKLYVPKSSFTYTSGWGGGFPVSGYLAFSSATATSLSFNKYGFFNDASATYVMDDSNTFYRYLNVTNAYGASGSISAVRMNVEQEGNKLYVRSVGSTIRLTYGSYGTQSFSVSQDGGKGTAVFNGQTSGGGEPTVPPTNWPDEPEAPEPPELPEPGTNPTVDPTPWSPVIDLPDLSFDLNITTDPTSEDILDWVKKIYYELKQFHRDAQQWFTEISDAFEDVVSAINDMSSQIYAQLQRMDSNVSSEFQQTRTYLHRLFQWLANQLDFDNDPYNDTNVIYWLKQIWSKLGGGINTRPTDPTSDPEDWWEWLVKAIQNFLIGLAATSSELISDFADVISQVMHQFPFSIPWDIAAFLAAFAAAPVTPEVTITIPAVEGWWDAFDYHISMSAFDTAAAAIRSMEKILFAAFLAWKSRDLLDFMDVTKWFNG